MRPQLITRILLIILLVTVTVVFSIFFLKKENSHRANQSLIKKISNSQKTEYGTSTPVNFLNIIPLPKNLELQQSYQLAYASQTQSTIVFKSEKTAEENFLIYKNFLQNKNMQEEDIPGGFWWLPNKNIFQASSISSLYAQNRQYDINITILNFNKEHTSAEKALSEITISLLKKR